MIKRTIEISRGAVYLSVRNDQLLVQPKGEEPKPAPTSIPCEDIGVLVIDEPGTTLSAGALRSLLGHGAAVVVCGTNHLPSGMLLPLSDHNLVVTRLGQQISAPLPLRKRLWQQLIVAKVRAQAANLEPGSVAARKLLALASEVRSGDPSNIEAQAARVYWLAWLGGRPADAARFKRDADGDAPNNLLNYGYSVVRAAVARALVAAGLQPALGLHHAHRANAFCLADDLLEPLRPLVDARARELYLAGQHVLDQPTKAGLLELLTARVETDAERGPLLVALHGYVASLVRCYAGEAKRLSIPTACAGEDGGSGSAEEDEVDPEENGDGGA